MRVLLFSNIISNYTSPGLSPRSQSVISLAQFLHTSARHLLELRHVRTGTDAAAATLTSTLTCPAGLDPGTAETSRVNRNICCNMTGEGSSEVQTLPQPRKLRVTQTPVKNNEKWGDKGGRRRREGSTGGRRSKRKG